MTVAQPDLSTRPTQCVIEHRMKAAPHAIFLAWTEQFDRWFAAPGTVLMQPRVDAPFKSGAGSERSAEGAKSKG